MSFLRVLVLTKRQYMHKDLIDDRFGRFREIPLALAQRGHGVNGLCLSYNYKPQELICDGPVSWKSINASRLKIPGLIKFTFEACRMTKRSDIIWACSDSVYGVIGYIVGRVCNRPVVFDIYDNFDGFFIAKLPIAKQLYRWTIRRSDAITCLSASFARFLEDRYQRTKRVYPLEFAVRKDLFKPLDKNRCRQSLGLSLEARLVGTAGGLYKSRDVHLLMEAFAILREKHADLQLVLAGPLDKKLSIPTDDRVHYVGNLPFDRVPELMNCLDVGVACYANDAFGKYCFPQKTREFMACNIPVIAANVGGLQELLKNHPEWLYEPGNVQSLIDVLERRLSDQRTAYPPLPSWNDLAQILENIMLELDHERE